MRVALALLRGYKLFVSPYFRGFCRFLPSCADYASEAIARHGIWQGSWLAAKRLVRCHPLCRAGHDPVPPAIRPVGSGFRLRVKLRRTAVALAQAVSRTAKTNP